MARSARAVRATQLGSLPIVRTGVLRRSARIAQSPHHIEARERHHVVPMRVQGNARKPRTPPQSIPDHVGRKRVLSVTDLVSPSWCEYAYLYNILAQSHLPLQQRPQSITTPQGNVLTPSWAQLQAREEVLARGVAVHDAIEREIQPVALTFRLAAPADEWALSLLQFAAGLYVARTRGCAREVPVVGYVHGRMVRGIVDELRHDGCTLTLSDTKTRRSSRLPPEMDQLQARLQVMLYKRLVDGLCRGLTESETEHMDPYAEPTSVETLCDTLQLDIDAPLSDVFQEDVATMVRTTPTPWTTLDIRALSLRSVQALARKALGPSLKRSIARQLELVYVRRQSAKPLGVVRFHAEPKILQDYLARVFLLLQGTRTPEGVAVHATRRCDSCAWREGCEWREAQAAAALPERYQRQSPREKYSDEALWSEFGIPEYELAHLQW